MDSSLVNLKTVSLGDEAIELAPKATDFGWSEDLTVANRPVSIGV
jgi:hypothetical protein